MGRFRWRIKPSERSLCSLAGLKLSHYTGRARAQPLQLRDSTAWRVADNISGCCWKSGLLGRLRKRKRLSLRVNFMDSRSLPRRCLANTTITSISLHPIDREHSQDWLCHFRIHYRQETKLLAKSLC